MGKRIDGLTLKERALVKAYTSIGESTFGNGLKSALVAYDTTDDNTAGALASRTLKKSNVQSAILDAMREHGINDNVQLASVKAVLTGDRVTETVTEHIDSNGQSNGTTVTRAKPTHRDVLQANRLLWKLSGRFDANKTMGKAVSSKLRAIAREFRPPLGRKGPEDSP